MQQSGPQYWQPGGYGAYGQPPAGQQPYGQPVPGQQPASQAAPVAPVATPGYAPPAGQQPNPQQTAQQAFTRHMVGVARNLEQLIPGYQIMVSVLLGLSGTPTGQSLTGLDSLLQTVKEATVYHYATLGAIRRILYGETTGEVASALALSLNQLVRVHSQLRPMLERVVMSAAPEQRSILSNLTQQLSGADSMLNETVSSVQGLVGPQVWDAARARVFGTDTTV